MADDKATSYVILIETADGNWKVAGNVTVPSGVRASTAKREGLAQFQPEGGTVVAIKLDDWTPEDLKPKLTFG